MAEPPDLDALARRYVSLWQEHLVATAGDPELTEAWTRWLALIARGATAMPAAWTMPLGDGAGEQAPARGRTRADGTAPGRAEEDGDASGSGDAAAARTATAADASGDREHDLVHLARRVAGLEGRLARIEASLAALATSPAATRRRPPRRRP